MLTAVLPLLSLRSLPRRTAISTTSAGTSTTTTTSGMPRRRPGTRWRRPSRSPIISLTPLSRRSISRSPTLVRLLPRARLPRPISLPLSPARSTPRRISQLSRRSMARSSSPPRCPIRARSVRRTLAMSLLSRVSPRPRISRLSVSV